MQILYYTCGLSDATSFHRDGNMSVWMTNNLSVRLYYSSKIDWSYQVGALFKTFWSFFALTSMQPCALCFALGVHALRHSRRNEIRSSVHRQLCAPVTVDVHERLDAVNGAMGLNKTSVIQIASRRVTACIGVSNASKYVRRYPWSKLQNRKKKCMADSQAFDGFSTKWYYYTAVMSVSYLI